MNNKVVLVLVDGMRPDGMLECGQPFVNELIKKSTYCLNGRTVMPSVTLPCHMALFTVLIPTDTECSQTPTCRRFVR